MSESTNQPAAPIDIADVGGDERLRGYLMALTAIVGVITAAAPATQRRRTRDGLEQLLDRRQLPVSEGAAAVYRGVVTRVRNAIRLG